MDRRSCRLIVAVLACIGLHLAPPAVRAAAFPDRPIRLIIGLTPGGAGDPIARAAAEGMTRVLGQSVFVEHRPGAAGLLAATAVANAHPDGYTLLVMSGALPSSIATHKRYPLSLKDFVPLSNLAEIPFVIASRYGSLAEFVRDGKSHPGKLDFGDNGLGSPGHLISEKFVMDAGLDVMRVHYKGSGETWQALLGGSVHVLFDTLTAGLAQQSNGKVHLHAVSSAARSPMAPDIPTFAELGYPGVAASAWFGIAAPAGTPPEVLDKLERAILAAGRDPAVRARIQSVGAQPVFSDRATTSAKLQTELNLWTGVADALRIEIE